MNNHNLTYLIAPINMTQLDILDPKYNNLTELDIADNVNITDITHLKHIKIIIIEPNECMHKYMVNRLKVKLLKTIDIHYRNSITNIHTNAKKLHDSEMKALCVKLCKNL